MRRTKSNIPGTAMCHCGSIKKGFKLDGRWICADCSRSLWMTMDTAPKDGTEILVYGFREGELTAVDSEPEVWRVSWFFKYWSMCGCEGYSVWINNPTHWMPLPEGPRHD